MQVKGFEIEGLVKVDKLEFQRGGVSANTDMKVKNEFKLEEFGNFETEEVPF